MKNKIVFRGLKLSGKEWVYGDLLSNNGQPVIVEQVKREYIETSDAGQGQHWYITSPAFKVTPETIGRYSQTEDKDGNYIYEGDKVKTGNGRIWEIRFGEYKYWTETSALGFYLYSKESVLPLVDCAKSLEVIGNIYENVE